MVHVNLLCVAALVVGLIGSKKSACNRSAASWVFQNHHHRHHHRRRRRRRRRPRQSLHHYYRALPVSALVLHLWVSVFV